MEGLGRTNQWFIILVMVTISMLCARAESRSPVLHRVGGGKYTWKPNVNFTEWAKHQHFYVGDWLCEFSLSLSLFSLCFSALVLFYHFCVLSFWSSRVNYADDSSKIIIQDFGFDKHKHNVLQVNKTNYEKCRDKDFIENVTRGGRDVFNLTEAKSFYFICGRGDYCSKGMKIVVHAETDPPPPTPSPHLITSASPSPLSACLHCCFLAHLLLGLRLKFM